MGWKTFSYKLPVIADTYIDNVSPANNYNFGHSTTLDLIGDTSNGISRPLFLFKIPAANERFIDYDGNDQKMPENVRIEDIYLRIFVTLLIPTPNTKTIEIRNLVDEFKEGYGVSIPNAGATWNKKDGDIANWSVNNGSFEVYLMPNQIISAAGETKWRLTYGETDDMIQYLSIAPGSVVKIGLKFANETSGSHLNQIASREHATAANHPYLQVDGQYWFDESETPDQEEAFLSVEPNPANPEQPLIKWKRPRNKPLKTDSGANSDGSYVLIKSTSPIQDYGDGNILVKESSALEYVDTGTVTDGIAYYYRMLICDDENYVDDAGGAWASSDVVGTPLWTNEVVIEKPKVNTFAETGADYSWDVWEEHTVQATCQTPTLNNVQNDAYQYDWAGDGSEVGWKELETPADLDTQAYSYTSYGGGSVTPKVRVRNSLGFWSAQVSLGSAITLTALDARAECRASPRLVNPSDVLRLRADESLDQNADGTITKYEFQVQRSSDSKYWDGANSWQVGVKWEDEGTTSFVDVPAAAIDHTASETYTCKSRVTGLSASTVTSASEVVTGAFETATEIRGGLSARTRISLLAGQQGVVETKDTPLEGTGDTIITEGVTSEVRRLTGISRIGDDAITDILQLHTWIEGKTLLKLQYNPMGSSAKYISFRISDLQERMRDENRIEWEVRANVEAKDT